MTNSTFIAAYGTCSPLRSSRRGVHAGHCAYHLRKGNDLADSTRRSRCDGRDGTHGDLHDVPGRQPSQEMEAKQPMKMAA